MPNSRWLASHTLCVRRSLFFDGIRQIVLDHDQGLVRWMLSRRKAFAPGRIRTGTFSFSGRTLRHTPRCCMIARNIDDVLDCLHISTHPNYPTFQRMPAFLSIFVSERLNELKRSPHGRKPLRAEISGTLERSSCLHFQANYAVNYMSRPPYAQWHLVRVSLWSAVDKAILFVNHFSEVFFLKVFKERLDRGICQGKDDRSQWTLL